MRLVDAYVDCGRFPVTRFPWAYARLARHHPRLWALLYAGTQFGLDPRYVIGPFLRAGLKRLFAEERPDVVVSTLPVVNGLLAREANHRARIEVVLTDWHSVHPFWVARGVDHYTAPTESARQDCLRFGAQPEVVDVVGIPVRREFAGGVSPDERRLMRSQCLSSLGLEPRRFTVLAMVGAEGSPRSLRNVAQLAAADLQADAQLVVVCGRNDELRQRVERLPARVPLKALGFVEDGANLMRAADLLVTKAGGLTLAEAFCCAVPVVIHDVLPGQEAGNLEYVLQHGAVAYAPRPRALIQVVAELASDARKREELGRRGAQLARPHAAAQIVENLLARARLPR